ncbi:hypothetical protein D3C76_957380 [compost metagenome]
MSSTRRPPGRLGSQRLNHGLPVVKSLCGHQLAKCGYPGPVAEQLAQGNRLLVSLGKFRPVTRNRNIQGQLALTHQLQSRHRGEHLGTGKQVGDGVAVPGLGAVLVSGTGPEVNDGFPANLDTQRRATLLRIVEQRRKGLAHGFELKLVMTLNLHPAAPRAYCYRKWRALFQPAAVLGTDTGQSVVQRARGNSPASGHHAFATELLRCFR